MALEFAAYSVFLHVMKSVQQTTELCNFAVPRQRDLIRK